MSSATILPDKTALSPGKPIPIKAIGREAPEVIEEVSSPVTIDDLTSRLFTLYYLKNTSSCTTLLYFKSPASIMEVVEYAKEYCVKGLNARFIRIDHTIHVVE